MQNIESSNIDLSIIIVTWNSEEDLPECLNSILDNNYDFKYEKGTINYLKNFGINNKTWFWFLDTKKDEHGIEE